MGKGMKLRYKILIGIGIFIIFTYLYGVFTVGFLEPYPKHCGWFPSFLPIQIIKFLNDFWILPQPIICVGAF